MEPVSSIANPISTSLAHTTSTSIKLMTATGTGGGSSGAGATSNKHQKQPTTVNSIGIARKVVQADLSNYNLDHLYCHTNEKKPNQQTTGQFVRGTSAATATGGSGPGTDIVSVIKEINQLRAMLLLHLDLIQEQSDQIMSKDKLIASLRKESESLRQRVIELTANPAPVSLPSNASAAVVSTMTQPAPVITKSGRCSRPVLMPSAVARDDSTNKVLATNQYKSTAVTSQIMHQQQQQPLKTPKSELVDSSELSPVIDTKSNILKKISTKILTNCTEKLNSLSANMESAYANSKINPAPSITASSPARMSPTTKPFIVSTTESALNNQTASPTDTKPVLSLLIQSKMTPSHEKNITLLQSIQQAEIAGNLLTKIKKEDLSEDVQDMLNDYANIKENKSHVTTEKQSDVDVLHCLTKDSKGPIGVNQDDFVIKVEVKVEPTQTPKSPNSSRRRRKRLEGTVTTQKRRRIARETTKSESELNDTNDTEAAPQAEPPSTNQKNALTTDNNSPANIPIIVTEPPSPAPPPSNQQPFMQRSFYSGRRSFMTTKQLYTTREWQMNEIAETVNQQIAEIDEEVNGSSATNEKVNLEIPRWKICDSTPCSSMSGSEDISEEAFQKRHARFELDEKKRKKWDIQRIREQRNVERLRKRLLKEDPQDVAKGPEDMGTFYPPAENIKFIQITDDLPIQAFGEFIPVIAATEFALPWQTNGQPRPANQFGASPAGHLRSSDKVAAANTSVVHTSIQLVKKKCVRRHYSSAATTTGVYSTTPSVPAPKGSRSTKKKR